MRRPTSITALALYLLIVFSLSLIVSVVGAVREIAPYSRETWLILMVPKVFAIAAGVAFWQMLRIGVWLWFASVILGWTNAIALNSYFPNLTTAAAISLLIVGASVWTIAVNWNLLRPLGARAAQAEVPQ